MNIFVAPTTEYLGWPPGDFDEEDDIRYAEDDLAWHRLINEDVSFDEAVRLIKFMEKIYNGKWQSRMHQEYWCEIGANDNEIQFYRTWPRAAPRTGKETVFGRPNGLPVVLNSSGQRLCTPPNVDAGCRRPDLVDAAF